MMETGCDKYIPGFGINKDTDENKITELKQSL